MLKFSVNITGSRELDKHIDYVNKLLTMKTDKGFQKFIQNKCLDAVAKVTNERMTFTGPTVESYKSNNKIEETSDGFILYNHTVVEATTEGYGGEYSIALAFEYGFGIVGEQNPKVNAWQYNVNEHKKPWIYYRNGFGWSKGYQGFEIYRYTSEEIKRNLKSWVNEYFSRKKGV